MNPGSTKSSTCGLELTALSILEYVSGSSTAPPFILTSCRESSHWQEMPSERNFSDRIVLENSSP